jgi:transposase-like protein
MDPATLFCPHLACPARGQVGQGNIRVHSRMDQRWLCIQCHKTFTATKGTALYRLRTPAQTVTLVLTLLAHGCPLQAIVVAFGFDERTVAAWMARAGVHRRAVHEHLVEQPHALGQVQADEIRVKKQGGVVWMASAMMVSTRLWLAGAVSAHRDLPLIRRLTKHVRAGALPPPVLFCTDGLGSYVRAIRETFRDAVATGTCGRPRLHPWPQLLIAQVVKRYEQYRVVDIERRILQGTATQIEEVRAASPGDGVLNTADIERLKATFRERLASLARRGRALARHLVTLEHSMYRLCWLIQKCAEKLVYMRRLNASETEPIPLAKRPPMASEIDRRTLTNRVCICLVRSTTSAPYTKVCAWQGQQPPLRSCVHPLWLPESPIIVGPSASCSRFKCRRPSGHLPSGAGVPRGCCNASWSGGVRDHG